MAMFTFWVLVVAAILVHHVVGQDEELDSRTKDAPVPTDVLIIGGSAVGLYLAVLVLTLIQSLVKQLFKKELTGKKRPAGNQIGLKHWALIFGLAVTGIQLYKRTDVPPELLFLTWTLLTCAIIALTPDPVPSSLGKYTSPGLVKQRK